MATFDSAGVPFHWSTAEPVVFGGIWEKWKSPDGEILQSFATITTDANQQLAGIQDRMPVIIEREDWPLWLGKAEGDPGSLLRPAPEDVLRIWPVRKAVGNFRNDGPELLKAIDCYGADAALTHSSRLA